jgi:integrase
MKKICLRLQSRTVKTKVKKDLGPLSITTKNYHLTAVTMFCNWMVENKRAISSPVEKIKQFKEDDDEHRRALSFDEVQTLLDTTEHEPERYGMTGHGRAVLYLTAIETGLRVRELRSLKVSSFDFDNCQVTVKAKNCKNRKTAVQILRYERAEQLKEFFKGKRPKDKAFNLPSHYRTAKMLKEDLEVAGIDYIDDAGLKADFHALRHTLATPLDETGVSVAERMNIMRHSRKKQGLTLGTYTHIKPYNIRRAIENLPPYSWPYQKQTEVMKATGTDGKNCLAFCSPSQGNFLRTSTDFNGQTEQNPINYVFDEKPSDEALSDVLGDKMRKEGDIGLVAQRQSSGLIIHWS